MGLKELMISIILVGIFTIALISMQINFSINNNSNNSLLNVEIVNRSYINMNSSFNTLQSEAETNKNATDQEIASPGFNSILLFSALTSARAITSIISTVFNVIIVLVGHVLGVNGLIIGVFSAILIFIMILYIWRTMRSGA